MSCLFISLAHFLPNINPYDLRQTICGFLEKNPKLLDEITADKIIMWEKRMSLNQYIHFMRSRSSWGGAIEIKAFCTLFKTNVLVRSFPNRRNIEFIGNKNQNKFLVITWNGGHYEPENIINK